jgi:hypothetical protein
MTTIRVNKKKEPECDHELRYLGSLYPDTHAFLCDTCKKNFLFDDFKESHEFIVIPDG